MTMSKRQHVCVSLSLIVDNVISPLSLIVDKSSNLCLASPPPYTQNVSVVLCFVSAKVANMMKVVLSILGMEIGFRNSYIFLLSVGKRPVVLQVNYQRMISKFFVYFIHDS